ncbi:tRNA (adenosine(37)-N6)-threonylcarbamoyltransferase complex ATPase subunit type 1 TsaE [Allomuricauda sp. d1]|uniref:tRNA (adenosine(37)-N6)-threonylcarbamoyltransferase complex ATPase subunit type 1 TsaE n=1 Tax=Allomuricauda sp. d1 TaxID=3136725 RepID=UPI0031DA7769
MEKIIYKKDELPQIAGQLLHKKQSNILCLYGEMGAGKTTLVKAMIKVLGGIDAGNSPTFGLVNEYHDAKGKLLAYHFDFYRIENEEEAYDLGLEDYLASGAWIFIEWPEKVERLIPSAHQRIFLQFIDENTRSIEF